MKLTVNGEPVDVDPHATVAALIRQFDLAHAACAVEVNRVLVPRREHDSHRLASGDTVEIVSLVGGG